MEPKSNSNAVYSNNYHLVWCPKYRRQVLVGAVADRLSELPDEVERVRLTAIIAKLFEQHEKAPKEAR